MSRLAAVEQTLDLPPGYTLVALREAGDAFAHGCAIAAEAGAGTLVWVRRYDLVEFAVVLEPDEPLVSARRAFFAGMNALADAIAAHCPPEREVKFDWPDAIIESFARHLMTAFDRWNERGFEAIARDYLDRLSARGEGERRGIDGNGDLLVRTSAGKGPPQRSGLVEALGRAAWYDPQARGPKLG